MGMGFSGSYAEVIESEKLAAIAPEAWSGVLKLLAEDVKEQGWPGQDVSNGHS